MSDWHQSGGSRQKGNESTKLAALLPFKIDTPLIWWGLAGALLFAALWQVTAPPDSILFSDFYQAYYATAERLWSDGPVATWPPNRTCTEGFVNIPVLGWLYVPFAWLSKPVAGWVYLSLGAIAVATAWALLTRFGRTDVQLSAPLLFLFLVNGPLVHSFREGNNSHFMLLLLLLALLFWGGGKEYAAGLVLGVCAAVKPPLMLYGLYFLLRRRWRVVAGGATAIALIAALSLLIFGLALNIGWYDHCVGPFLNNIIPGFNAQSIDAFLFRLVYGEYYLHVWNLIEPPAAIRVVRNIILAVLLSGAAALIWRANRMEPVPPAVGALSPRDLLEYVLVLNLAIVASPLSWSHYYLLLLLPWGLYLAHRLPLADDATTKWLMGGGIVLGSLPVFMLPQDLGTLGPALSRSAVSATLFGGLLTLAALMRGAWQMPKLSAERSCLVYRGGPARPAAWPRAVRLLKGKGLSSSELLSRNLMLFFLLNAVLLNVILWIVPLTGFGEFVLQHTRDFLLGQSDNDSWGPMYRALAYFEQEYLPPASPTPIYTELVFNRSEKFQYPPSSLFIIAAARGLDESLHVPFAIGALSWLSVIVTALATVLLLENRLRLSDPSCKVDNTAWLRIAAVLGLSLIFYPVIKAFTLGQIQAWINGLFALTLLFWALGRRAFAGLLIGLIALIKPHYGLILLWGLLRQAWSFAAAGIVVVLAGVALSLYVFGWANHVDYLHFLSYLSARGEAYYPNQSINGLLNRLMGLTDPLNYNNLTWLDGRFPPFNPWVYAGTVGSSLLILALAFLRGRRAEDPDGTLDFCTIAVACTVASPIAWEHHYGILLPVYAVLLAAFRFDHRRLIWIGVSYVLASNYFSAAKLLAQSSFNFAQSYLLAAALIVLAALLWRPASLKARAAIGVPADAHRNTVP